MQRECGRGVHGILPGCSTHSASMLEIKLVEQFCRCDWWCARWRGAVRRAGAFEVLENLADQLRVLNTEMIFSVPPQCSQVSMSMSKTRFRRCAQLMATCRGAALASFCVGFVRPNWCRVRE